MALDDLPGTLEVPTRDAIATSFRRDYGIVSPESDTSDGTQPDVLAKTVSITLLPVYSNAVLIANGTNEDAATGKRLDLVGARYGVPRPQAAGASGYVLVSASAGGGTIQAGDEIKNRQTGKRYQAAETKTLINNGQIRIVGLDTGPATNLAPTTTLQWSAPRPGIGQTATVDSGGLIGGADVADDASYVALIREARRNPPNADNDAAVQQVIRSTPGLSIAAVFSYPAVFGPGTYAFTFLLSSSAGANPANRIPNAAQRLAALAWMTGQLPGDDSYFCAQSSASAEALAFRVTWDPGSPGWADYSTPWPAWKQRGLPAGTAGAIVVTAAASATSFTIGTDNSDYTAAVAPQAQQSIGLWDGTALLFRRKTINAVAGTGPWTVTIETAGASDQQYTPALGTRVMPWSDSLADLIAPVLATFNAMGPGEMFASFAGDGRRQRRNPVPPKSYPQFVSSSSIVSILNLPSIQTAAIAEGGAQVPVGTPGITIFLRTLADLAAFP